MQWIVSASQAALPLSGVPFSGETLIQVVPLHASVNACSGNTCFQLFVAETVFTKGM